MAAWVFPLTVKLLLQRDGLYTLSDHDEGHCLAVDKLLAATDWCKKTDSGNGLHKWQEIVSSTTSKYEAERIEKQILEQTQHLVPADPPA